MPPSDFRHTGSCWRYVAFPALVGEGAGWFDSSPRILQQLSGWGLQQPWLPHISQGPYGPNAISLPSVFQCPVQILASKLHISWVSIGCSLCSSEDQLGPRCSRWGQGDVGSPPTPCCHLLSTYILIQGTNKMLWIWSLTDMNLEIQEA